MGDSGYSLLSRYKTNIDCAWMGLTILKRRTAFSSAHYHLSLVFGNHFFPPNFPLPKRVRIVRIRKKNGWYIWYRHNSVNREETARRSHLSDCVIRDLFEFSSIRFPFLLQNVRNVHNAAFAVIKFHKQYDYDDE